MAGTSTRLTQAFSEELKRIWKEKKSWPNGTELFMSMLKLTNGNEKLSVQVIAGLSFAYNITVRELLRRKGRTESDMSKINAKGQEDGSLSVILEKNGHLLSVDEYDEYPLAQAMLRLQNFARHTSEVEHVVAAYREAHPISSPEASTTVQRTFADLAISTDSDTIELLRDQNESLKQALLLLLSADPRSLETIRSGLLQSLNVGSEPKRSDAAAMTMTITTTPAGVALVMGGNRPLEADHLSSTVREESESEETCRV